MKITARSIGEADYSRQDKLPIRAGWDDYVDKFITEKAPEGLKNVF